MTKNIVANALKTKLIRYDLSCLFSVSIIINCKKPIAFKSAQICCWLDERSCRKKNDY